MSPRKMEIIWIPEGCGMCEIVNKNIHYKGENEESMWGNSWPDKPFN